MTEWFHFNFSLHALEKEMATHSSVLPWRIPGAGEPGGLPSMGLHRVRHDWSNLAAAAILHGVYVPQLSYPFICWWTSRLLPCPGYYKQCCDEHWGTRVSFNSGFLSVYTQQWDCWIIRQFYLLWMWPTWFLGWERLRIFSLRVGRIVSFSEILLSNRVVIDTSSRWGEEHAGEEWAWVHQERWSPVFPQNAKLIWVFSYHSVMNHR